MTLTGFTMHTVDVHAYRLAPLFRAVFIVTAALLAICAIFAPNVQAMAATRSDGSAGLTMQNEGYLAVLYNNTNGLPTSEANDIAQTDEGFMWIGTYSGLVRYDGNAFVRIGTDQGIANVRSLYVDSLGRLWVGSNDNGIFLMERDSFRRWGEEDGLPSSSVRAILEDEQGIIYVATTGGVVTIDPEFRVSAIGDPRVDRVYMYDLRIGIDGCIYGLTNDGDVFTIEGGEIGLYLNGEDICDGGVNCLFPDPERPGHVYIETADSEILHGELADGVSSMDSLGASPLPQAQRFEYIDGFIWICSRNGIGILGTDGIEVLQGLPMDNSVGHAIADYAGNLWFTSTRQGVMKIVPSRFTDLFDRFELQSQVVNSTCLLDGRLYIATDAGLKVVDADGVVPSIPLTKAQTASGVDMGATDLLELLSTCRIRSVIRDSQERLWFSTWHSHGLVRYDHGEVVAFTEQDGLFSDYVRAVCERDDGSFLVAMYGGVNVIEGDRVVAGYNEDDGMVNSEVLTVEEGFDGDILCGLDTGGIYVIGKGGLRHIGRAEGLRSDTVLRIKRDTDRRLFWVVTGNSIAFLDDNYEVHNVEGFPNSNNFDLYENGRDEIWVLSSDGVYIARAEDMLGGDTIDSIHYGVSEGLPYIATANSYSELTDTGDLYIAGSAGVAKVNVNRFVTQIGDLKAAIPYVEADGVRVYPDEEGTFTIASDVRKLTFYGFVYNYSLVNPDVSYHLEGFDHSDTTVSRNELGPVDYTNLSGGRYRFVMELRDSVHRNTKTVSANIVKVKAFYEEPWFYALIVLATGLALYCGVSRYVHRRIALLEEKNREEAEKERIETELDMARQIQAGVLPKNFSAISDNLDVDIYASAEPAKEVGGDFYDFFMVDDNHLCLVIADVSGKGIPAALFMMDAKSILKNNVLLGLSPAEALRKTNETICASNEMGMFVTVWLGILDLSNGKLVASNGGHEYPVLRRAGAGFELIKDKHDLVVGVMDFVKYREYELQLQPGDALFVYTDGVPEANNAHEELFGFERLVEALNRDPDTPPKQLLATVRRAVQDFAGDAEQYDDVTMLCVEYHRPES